MEKDHFRSRKTSDRRNGLNGGAKGRGNVSGSISYAEFRRNGGSKARDERNEKMILQRSEEMPRASRFGESFAREKSENRGFGEKKYAGRAESNRFGERKPFARTGNSRFGEGSNRFGESGNRFGEHGNRFGDQRSRRNDDHSAMMNERPRRNNDRTEFVGGRTRRNDERNNFGGAYPRTDSGRFENNRFNSFDKSFEKKPKRQTQPTYEKANFVDYSKPMRLNRFLANAGVCSRREADSFIQAGVVSVNGNIITELGSRVTPDTDKVLFHDELVKIERRVYILLNKPKDYVTTAEDIHAKKTVLDLVKGACGERVYPVGRLDRNTTGVLLITNDGELTSKLTHPSFNKKKIYQVTLDHDVSEADVEKITNGIMLEDGEIKVDEFSFIKEEDRKNVGVEIHSGRNRIVRRIFESLGYKVMRLDRVYFAGLTKKNLPRGKWRFLSEKEVVFLKMNANNPTENC